MKKRMLSVLLGTALICTMLSGCANANPTMADGTVSVEESTTEESSSETVVVESTPESIEEPEPEPEPLTWFDEHGLVITPQGDFTYVTMARDANYVDLDTFEVKANAVITENTEGVEDGYKEVILVYTRDASAVYDIAGSNGLKNWGSAFDRYTGTSFEFDSETTYTVEGETDHKDGFVTIVNGDTSYDVSISFDGTNEYPKFTDTITVTCPIDYDGVVFQIGYSDSKLTEANQAIDYTARLYTIDELPYFGDGYYYFSYTNK